MKIKLTEPTSPRYIYFNRDTNQLHVMVPIVGGDSIGTDNTCKSATALKTFLGKNADSVTRRNSILDELQRYKAAIECDLRILPDDHLFKREKQERLRQIEEFIRAIQVISASSEVSGLDSGFPTYPQCIQELLRQRSGSYSMLLSPSYPDSMLRMQNPVFAVARDGRRGLGTILREQFSRFTVLPNQSPSARIKAAALRELSSLSPPIDEHKYGQICRTLVAKTQELYHQPIANLHGYTNARAEGYLDDDATAEEYIDLLLNSLNQLFATIPSSPFSELNPSLHGHNERLSILTQFFLAQINIHCYARNISARNFGTLLDINHDLCLRIANAVKEALRSGQSVEGAIIQVINSNVGIFGLQRTLTPDDVATIKGRFLLHWNTIKESPHFDEFLVLDTVRGGKFVAHQGSICTDLSEVIRSYPTLDSSFIVQNRRDFESINGTLSHKNEAISSFLEIEDDRLAGNISRLLSNRESIPTLARLLLARTEDDRIVFRALPETVTRVIRQHGNFRELYNQMARQISDDENLLREFNQQFSDQEVLFNLTSEMARTLYVAAVEFFGSAECPSGYQSVEDVNRLLTSFGFNVNSLQVSDGDGFMLRANQSAITMIQEQHSNYQNTIYLTPAMAKSIYTEVTEMYGRESTEYQQMMAKNNRDIKTPHKLLHAFALLRLGKPADICYPTFKGTDGYILKTTPADIRMINNIHQSRSRTHITKEMVIAIYRAVDSQGRSHELEGLTTEGRPEKFARALDILGITYRNLAFNYENGFLVDLSDEGKARLNRITPIQPTSPAPVSQLASTAPSPALSSAALSFAGRDEVIVGRDGVTPIDLLTPTLNVPYILQQTSASAAAAAAPLTEHYLGRLASGRDAVIEGGDRDGTIEVTPPDLSAPVPSASARAAAAAAAVDQNPLSAGNPRLDAPTSADSHSRDLAQGPDSPQPARVPERTRRFMVEYSSSYQPPGDMNRGNNQVPEVQLNCPQNILTAFRNLLRGTAILGAEWGNPYDEGPMDARHIPTDVDQLTGAHLQILARNEHYNTTGKMKVRNYEGLLNADQIARLRCLVKATTVAGLCTVHHVGGYPIGNPLRALNPSVQSIIIDQSGLQWQGDFRNTGGMFFYPTNPSDRNLPANYQAWQNDMFQAMYASTRPSCSSNSIEVQWCLDRRDASAPRVNGRVDLTLVALAIEIEFRQALAAAVAQGEYLAPDARINFKYLKAGMGFFADGIVGNETQQIALEKARLAGIAQALTYIAAWPDTQKRQILGKVRRIELPYSSGRDELANISRLVIELGLEWGGAPREDALEPRPGFVNALNNCGDPHAMAGNEGGYMSVDAAIASNAFVVRLNAVVNERMQVRVTPIFQPSTIAVGQETRAAAAAAAVPSSSGLASSASAARAAVSDGRDLAPREQPRPAPKQASQGTSGWFSWLNFSSSNSTTQQPTPPASSFSLFGRNNTQGDSQQINRQNHERIKTYLRENTDARTEVWRQIRLGSAIAFVGVTPEGCPGIMMIGTFHQIELRGDELIVLDLMQGRQSVSNLNDKNQIIAHVAAHLAMLPVTAPRP